jgi:hypothetical protein
MANKVKIKDEQGNQVFPITHVSAVLNDNGDNIGEIVSSKQNELVSGSNIKTINGQSLLGSGNITIQGGSGGGGDANVIESITFNGNAVPVDVNKNAAISYTAPVTSVNGDTGAVTVSVPTKVSDLTNDSGFISSYTETDPVFIASAAYGITSSDIANWNSKQAALVSGTNIKTINNESILGIGNISISGGYIQEVVSGASITQALSPNVFYSFGTVTSLTATLDTPVSGMTNEYSFEFDSGSTPTTLSLPAAVQGIDATAIKANKHYEVSIKYDASNQNYYGLIQEW